MNADKQNEILGLSWCSEEAHRQVGGRWKDRRMSSGWFGWKVMPRWLGGGLSRTRQGRGLCRRGCRNTGGLARWWDEIGPKPSQVEKKVTPVFSKGSGQKNDLFEGSEWCFGRLMVGWPSQPFHLG